MAGKSGGLLALLATPKGKGGSEKSGPPAPEGDTGGSEVASALRDMFDALKAGDDEGAALAFKSAYHACADEGTDEPELDLGDEEEEPELEM